MMSHRCIQIKKPWISWDLVPRDVWFSNKPAEAVTWGNAHLFHQVSQWCCSIQLLSCVQFFATAWTAAYQASLSVTTPGVGSNSCPLSWWGHPTISSVVPFSSCLQSFSVMLYESFTHFGSTSILFNQKLWTTTMFLADKEVSQTGVAPFESS